MNNYVNNSSVATNSQATVLDGAMTVKELTELKARGFSTASLEELEKAYILSNKHKKVFADCLKQIESALQEKMQANEQLSFSFDGITYDMTNASNNKITYYGTQAQVCDLLEREGYNQFVIVKKALDTKALEEAIMNGALPANIQNQIVRNIAVQSKFNIK